MNQSDIKQKYGYLLAAFEDQRAKDDYIIMLTSFENHDLEGLLQHLITVSDEMNKFGYYKLDFTRQLAKTLREYWNVDQGREFTRFVLDHLDKLHPDIFESVLYNALERHPVLSFWRRNSEDEHLLELISNSFPDRSVLADLLVRKFASYINTDNLGYILDWLFVPVRIPDIVKFLGWFIVENNYQDVDETYNLVKALKTVRNFLIRHHIDPKLFPIPVHYEMSDDELENLQRAYKQVFFPKWDVLRENIVGKSLNFVWEQFCKTFGSTDVQKYRQLAKEFDIPGAEHMNKAQLCGALNDLQNAYIQPEAETCNLDETDSWSLDALRDIPPYRRFKIGHQCFDLLSLKSAIDHGITENPITRQPLPTSQIDAAYDRLSKMMIKKDDFLERVRSTPILSQTAMMSQMLGHIWSKLDYPVSAEDFLKSSDDDLMAMWNEMICYQVLPIASMTRAFMESRNKHASMLNILSRIVDMPVDEYTTTRHRAIEMALNNNIKSTSRRRRRDDEVDEENVSQRRRLEGGRTRKYTRR